MKLKYIILIIIISLVSLLFLPAQSQVSNVIKIQMGGKLYETGYIKTDHVRTVNLQRIFGFDYQPGLNSKYVRINGIRFDGDVVFQNGAHYVPIESFFKFFLVRFNKSKSGEYIILYPGMLNPGLASSGNIRLKVEGKEPRNFSTILYKRDVFLNAKEFADYSGMKFNLDRSSGTAVFNNKRIERWAYKTGEPYVYLPELQIACGKRILPGKPDQGESSAKKQNLEKIKEIRNNISASYRADYQFGTLNPKEPIGYRIVIQVSNGFRQPIKVEPYFLVLTDDKGNRYSGNIVGISGNLPALENPFGPGVGNYIGYYTVQAGEDEDIVTDFFPPKGAEPGCFIFEFQGVELMRVDIMRSYIP
ncbi:MAG: hypothetical protein K8T10_20055 [Candidatus Eremiobacteraeota bacterium]|nr:hypothetical protein [Candidatus Eremiobacteraeota bacterium]